MSPDVAASVRARLLDQAKARGEEFERTLARFAGERLLFRLGACAARDRCILKGASLLAVWMPDPYRATRDVDVLASCTMDDPAILSLIAEICAVACPEDGLRFDLSELVVEAIRAEEEYSGKRARFRAFLGQARIAVQLDLGVGDAIAIAPEEITYPTMLSSLPAPRLRAYPREQTVAEKFEAMVKLDTRNSRMKDFHDVWALAGAFEFDGAALQHAVAACFERRRTPWTEEAPRALTTAFYHLPELTTRWRNYLAAGAVLIPPPVRFGAIGERITSFLGPLRDSIVATEPFAQTWLPSGPWNPSEERSR
ncbi:MAG: nucleotidyl transferase AbiEii/AbiGii toxin family protein [Candidatus Eisenbacteria bacterium]|nr:nucleotidyl transferase AbiEii/AbiGii toxin family protein [Candidatus Eisenbacteria bacterium]